MERECTIWKCRIRALWGEKNNEVFCSIFGEMTTGFVKYLKNKNYLCEVCCDNESIVNVLSFLQSIRELNLKKNGEKRIFVKINE